MADDASPSSDGGENFTVKLESLGPIIVNTDGSMQRIPNWNEMPQSEKDKTMRLVSARNKKRMMALRNANADGCKGNLLDNIIMEESTQIDPMTGSGSGNGVKLMTLEIENH